MMAVQFANRLLQTCLL